MLVRIKYTTIESVLDASAFFSPHTRHAPRSSLGHVEFPRKLAGSGFISLAAALATCICQDNRDIRTDLTSLPSL